MIYITLQEEYNSVQVLHQEGFMSKGVPWGSSTPRMVQKKRNTRACLTIDSNDQLLEAIRKGQPKLVKQLLWSNADPNARDDRRQSGLILACFVKDHDSRMTIIDLLLQKGATVDLQDESGQTALVKVVILDDIILTKHLLKHGADATLHDKEGNTSLLYASLNGNEKIVQCLISEFQKHQKSVDERNMRGLTPLLAACQNNHLECAQVLVLQGNANPMLRDLDHFMSPLDWMQSSSLTWHSREDLEFLSPHMRKKNYYRQQRKLKGTKILSDYLKEGSMVQCESPNMFMIKKDCVSSNSTLSHASTDSGFSELNFNNSNNKQPKSMFDLPKIMSLQPMTTIKPIHNGHSIVKQVHTARHELPVIGSFTKPDLYRSVKFQKRLGANLRTSKACPNLLEPLVTSPSASDKLKRLNSISELIEEDGPDMMTKHHTIPPLKRKPSKPFI